MKPGRCPGIKIIRIKPCCIGIIFIGIGFERGSGGAAGERRVAKEERFQFVEAKLGSDRLKLKAINGYKWGIITYPKWRENFF